jgi:hypothetical protein
MSAWPPRIANCCLGGVRYRPRRRADRGAAGRRGYLSNQNLTAVGPDRLIAIGTGRVVRSTARQDPTSGPPLAGATPPDAMAHRLRTPQEPRCRRRAATVEPVNGHLKDQVGLRRFARRGLNAGASEPHLAATVLNLLKMHARTA